MIFVLKTAHSAPHQGHCGQGVAFALSNPDKNTVTRRVEPFLIRSSLPVPVSALFTNVGLEPRPIVVVWICAVDGVAVRAHAPVPQWMGWSDLALASWPLYNDLAALKHPPAQIT